jgi:hypothetical protein
MAWTASGLGSLHGITGVIAGMTGITADLAQISAVKTLLLAEVAGICTSLYNGARLDASGDATGGPRTIQVSLIPLNLSL